MKIVKLLLCGLPALFLMACSSSVGLDNISNEGDIFEADVVIYGGTSGGVIAAIQCAREGKSAILLGPDEQLGAMTSSGLGYTDAGKSATIGGASREFYHRIWKEYQKPNAWNLQKRKDWKGKGQENTGIDDKNQLMWIFEPKVAERVYENWLAEHKIPVHRGEWLDRENGVKKSGGKIVEIKTLSGKRYRGKIFMDCTFEGDLYASAGCDYHVGRESSAQYKEKYNGVQTLNSIKHNFEKNISPYIVEGDPKSGKMKFISGEHPGKQGDADKKVQAYCFRMCLSSVKENQIPFEKPANYNADDYLLSLRYMLSEPDKEIMIFSAMPNFKTDCNNKNAFSTDFIGGNYAYPEASYEERAKIIQAHKDYQMGWYYFICNDPRVPEEKRNEMQKWGLAKDEFTKTGGWPFNLYIREARRLIGEYVMTEHDCVSRANTPKSIGMGSYTMDSHNVQRYITPEGCVKNEGDIQIRITYPYKISYLSITPKRAQCENLLVPVACSSSHIAFGSIRMEPVFMVLGQSAASAASIAIDDDVAVQNVDYEKLKSKLLKDGQVLEMSEKMKADCDAHALYRAKRAAQKAAEAAKKLEKKSF